MEKRVNLITPVLVGGCIIMLISFAIRASFGVFQIPIAEDFGWLRTDFSLAIAIQNLAWGIGGPVFGALAEKIGDRRAIVIGALVYSAGLLLSSFAVTPLQHQFLEVAVGFGVAGTGFGVILAVVGRAASDDNRSMALAVATAAGSAGQVVGPPMAEFLLSMMTWQWVFGDQCFCRGTCWLVDEVSRLGCRFDNQFRAQTFSTATRADAGIASLGVKCRSTIRMTTAALISMRCAAMASVSHQGMTSPAPFPFAGQMRRRYRPIRCAGRGAPAGACHVWPIGV